MLLLCLVLWAVLVIGFLWIRGSIGNGGLVLSAVLGIPIVIAILSTRSQKWRESLDQEPKFMKEGRRAGHCVNCGYDLAGNESGHGPECGEPR